MCPYMHQSEGQAQEMKKCDQNHLLSRKAQGSENEIVSHQKTIGEWDLGRFRGDLKETTPHGLRCLNV